jgi:hypothetical protein
MCVGYQSAMLDTVVGVLCRGFQRRRSAMPSARLGTAAATAGMLAAIAYRSGRRRAGWPPPFRITVRDGMATTGTASIIVTIENRGIRPATIASAGVHFQVDRLGQPQERVPSVLLIGPADDRPEVMPGASAVLSYSFEDQPLPCPADTPIRVWAQLLTSSPVLAEPASFFSDWLRAGWRPRTDADESA